MNRSRTETGREDIYRPAAAAIRRLEPLTDMEILLEAALVSGLPLGHMPGQFVEVSIPGFGECPISLSSAPGTGPSFELAVRKVGRVTAAIHRLAPGDGIGIRGPFGTHYPVDSEMKGKDLLFIGAGLGLAPIRSVIQYTLRRRDDYGHIQILPGGEDRRGIVNFALEIENNSIVFYLGLKDLIPARLGPDKIDKIIREEMRHIVWLNGCLGRED